MSNTYLLQNLNDEQREAVTCDPCNLVIVAGAGTGKTTVLVSKIAFFIDVLGLESSSILALTFTNKAAFELKERIAKTLGDEKARNIWSYTFHSFCLKILKIYNKEAKLPSDFLVLGVQDQISLIKSIIDDLPNLSEENKKALKKEAKCYVQEISSLKEEGIRSKGSYVSSYDYFELIYPIYEEICNQRGLVDFSELILRAKELIESSDNVRKRLHRKFKEILIDEFQDTSTLQYELIKLIKGPDSHLTVVGDDDQSIYAWRGANFNNLNICQRDYDAKVVPLETNYRSTQHILNIANSLISHNTTRLIEKHLKAFNETGPLNTTYLNLNSEVSLIKTRDSSSEAFCIVNIIESIKAKRNYTNKDIAILYRNSSQSAYIEKALVNAHIPYKLRGGMRFYDREEVLDLLAYLKVLVSHNDDVSFMRIVNKPARRIGKAALESLSIYAKQKSLSLYLALCDLVENELNASSDDKLKKLAKTLKPFYSLIYEIKNTKYESIVSLINDLLVKSNLLSFYEEKDKKNNNTDKVDSFTTIKAQAYDFETQSIESDEFYDVHTNLINFILTITLYDSSENVQTIGAELQDHVEKDDVVNLMTIHTSKGLEFPVCIVAGFEKNILPYPKRVSDLEELEEERRLAYVAITRAKSELYLIYALERFSFYDESFRPTGPSQFVKEIKENLGENNKSLKDFSFRNN